MEKLIFQFIIILLFWVGNKKAKKAWLSPSSWLLGLYLLGSFLGIIDLTIETYHAPYRLDFWFPLILFLFTLLLFLLPFRTFNEMRISQLAFPNKRFLNLMSVVIIILSFYAIIFYMSSVIRIFTMGDLSALRNMRYSTGEEFVEGGIMNTIASVSASLYPFALLLFFVYACLGNSKWRCILLLLSSFSEAIHILTFVGRDGIVFWIFSFVFLFLLFKPYLPSERISKLKKWFLVGSVALMIPFFAITSSRFDDSDTGVGGSVVSYMGQQFVNGPIYFSLDNPPVKPWASFPLVREIFHLPEPRESDRNVLVGEWNPGGFSTFLSSFHGNFGYLGMYFIAILSLFFFHVTVGRCKKTMRLHNIIIYILYFQIFGQGVFYFRQYTRGGNLFILLCILMYVFFRLIPQKGRVVLAKN